MEHILSITYEITILLAGSFFCYLGYNLFKLGLFEKAGDLKASWGDKHLILKQASPGIFFAVFGAIIIVVSVSKDKSIRTIIKESKNTPINRPIIYGNSNIQKLFIDSDTSLSLEEKLALMKKREVVYLKMIDSLLFETRDILETRHEERENRFA
jgi:hypothetical protein